MCPEGALKSRRKERFAMKKAERGMNMPSQGSGLARPAMYAQPVQYPNSAIADPSISNMSLQNSLRVPQRMNKVSL
jgi:hypothetical protein